MDTSKFDAFLRKYTASRILVVGSFICVTLWIVYRFGFGGGDGTTTPPAVGSVVNSNPLADPSLALFGEEEGVPAAGSVRRSPTASKPKMDAVTLEQRIGQVRNAELKKMVEETVAAVESWSQARDEWNSLMIDVTDGNTGRVLAADSEKLPRLMELIRIGTERAGAFSNVKSQVDTVAVELNRFLSGDGDGEATEKTRDVIESLRELVDVKMTEQLASLDELREHVKNAQGKPPGDATLKQAMVAYRKAEEKKAIDAAISARDQVRRESTERLLEAERMKARAEVELEEANLAAETERLKAETEQKRITADRMKQEDEAKLAKTRLEADFVRDMQEINSLLSPFVSRAPYTLHPPHSGQYSGQNTGASLGTIVRWGALEPSDDGLDAMAQLGSPPYRPLGTFPKFVQSEWKRNPDVKARLERAQELLRKYGDLLVEKGILEK